MKNISYYLSYLRKYETILASSLLIVVVLSLTIFYLIPSIFKYLENTKNISKLKSQYDTIKRKNILLSTLDYDLYKNNLEKIYRILPPDKDYVSLFNTLDSLESTTGVIVNNADLTLGVISTNSATFKKTKGTDAFSIPITLNIKGNRDNIHNFFESLTNLSGRLIAIEEVKWIFNENGLINAGVEGYAYFYPLAVNLTKIDQPLPQLSTEDDKILKIIEQSEISVNEEEDMVPIGKSNLFE